MIAALCVGAGGFCGAIARYLLGLLPYQGQFPLITFVINFTGAVAIGAVVEAASVRPGMLPSNAVLFVKTGLCGGFTTFSTFSLETLGAARARRIRHRRRLCARQLGRMRAGRRRRQDAGALGAGGASGLAQRQRRSRGKPRCNLIAPSPQRPAPDTVQQSCIAITSDAPIRRRASSPAIRPETRKSRPQRQALQAAYRPKQQAKATSP